MNTKSAPKPLLILFFLILTAANNSEGQDIDAIFGDKPETYFRFEIQDKPTLIRIGRVISIDRIDSKWVYAYANRMGFPKFLEERIDFEILRHPGELDYEPKMLSNINAREIEDWDFYPTYKGYVDLMFQFEADYPELCDVFSIGTTIEGREILMARISDNVGLKEREPQFLYTSTMHGDETAGYVLMLRFIDYLLSEYGTNQRITGLVDNIDIWINPLANPDGTYRVGNHTVNGAIRGNHNGIDINRNFPDPVGGPHPDGYAWQPETIIFMDLAEDNHFVSASNLHGGAEVCNYPWDTWERFHVDTDWWEYVCREYADTAHEYAPPGYMDFKDNGVTNGYAWYHVEGGRQDFMNYFHQCREFTLELSDQKLLNSWELPAHWEYNYRSFLNYMEQSTFGFSGTVKDSVSNFPVSAEIFILNHDNTDDSSMVFSHLPLGYYHRLVSEGNYFMRVQAEGYYTKLIPNVSVNNRDHLELNIKLVPEGVGGVDQNSVSSGITVFPNPSTGGKLKIRSETEITRIKIYTVSGQMVGTFRIYDKVTEIETSSLRPGQYYLDIDTPRGRGAKTIVVR